MAETRAKSESAKHRFDVSPKTYLTTVRLHGARKDLRRRPPKTTVTDVANRWGFWHMGDFAMNYRRVFGELPSESPRTREV
jgi:AraC family ethanolamine operon transcriptional activator